MLAKALTIAGSDPSGGAGLQADLKTFHQHSVYGMSVVTLLTVQNTQTVKAVEHVKASFVIEQLETVLEDIYPQAAKTGALGSGDIIEAIASRAQRFSFPLVVDPVMVSKHGAVLLDKDASYVFRRYLLPHAYLVTPNLSEATELVEDVVCDEKSMKKAAATIAKHGPRHVLVKGGHLVEEAIDVLWSDGEIHTFRERKIDSTNTHGTGCVLSAAITAQLALGQTVLNAVRSGKKFVTDAILRSIPVGKGIGPTNMFCQPVRLS